MFEILTKRFSALFSRLSGNGILTEKNIQKVLEEIKDALLDADVPYNVVEQFISEVKLETLGQKILQSLKPGDQLVKIVHEKIKQFLGQQPQISHRSQLCLMVMGLQGSGKTTSLAKIAYWFKHKSDYYKKSSVLLASVDFYRPAAIEQLESLASKINIPYYRASSNNPIKAAQEIFHYWKMNNFNILLLDTAGRLHIDQAMMQELCEIEACMQAHYKLLVLDAMTGQESLQVAQSFNQAIGFDAAMLTKMDSDTRGGAAFTFRYSLKKPILFIGTGEKPKDITLFYPDRLAGRILGMGDVLTLVEKTQEKVKKEEQERMQNSFMKGTFNLNDFVKQLDMMNAVGPLGQMLKYISGIPSLSDVDLARGERALSSYRAIIQSMTMKERCTPAILNYSRKQRIAKGAGVRVEDISALLKGFEQMKQYAKLFKRFARF
jgi:signal recognition particle subunit SRP54